MLSRQAQVRVKYAVDRVAAAILLVLLSPLAAVIAVLIKLDSRGPAVFRQQRVGLGGCRFTIYKFRSMVENADALLDAHGRVRCNRLTRVGRLLRLLSLDELPQLINILRGEMSFIGPRPGLAERHERSTPWQQRRCEMKPGITGLAQVHGRNTVLWSRRVELDVQYVDSYSWWLDVRILVRTFWVVLTRAGIVLDRNPDQVDDIGDPAARSSSDAQRPFSHGTFRRIEQRYVDRLRKDSGYEDLLSNLNHALTESHDRELQDLPEQFSTIHVVGTPRSGTTLLSQLVSSCLDVGYINNLIAPFWRVPCYGIRLSTRVLAGVRPSCFRSEFGRTSEIGEPHEFGYFWSYMLGYRQLVQQDDDFEREIDWDRLRRLLINMAHTFGKPVVFKPALLAWHIRKVQQVLPKTIFLWIRRDPVDTALSLLNGRQAHFGSIEEWFSLKPREFAWLQNEPVPTQLAGQVFFIEQSIARQVEQVCGRNILQVSYEQLCQSPQSIIDNVQLLLRQNGQEAALINEPPRRFDPPSGRSSQHPFYLPLKAAVERFYGEAGAKSPNIRRAG